MRALSISIFSCLVFFVHVQLSLAQLAFYGGTDTNVGSTEYEFGVLYRFVPSTGDLSVVSNGSATDGNEITGLVRVDDLLYGTMAYHGAHNAGTIFSFDMATDTYTKLADFDSINGKWPVDAMVPAPNGKLYGVTVFGGDDNRGVLFSFDPSNNEIEKLVDFASGSYSQPSAGLVMGSNGNLYGMVSYYYGGLFEYNIATNDLQYIFHFPSTGAGRVPWSPLTEVQDSVFYGSTRYGGVAQNGTLFKFDQRTNTFTTVKFFQGGADGEWPMHKLAKVGNLLYGFTYKGGVDTYGTYFKHDLLTDQFTKLFDLDYPVGAYPDSPAMLASDGKIYAPTSSGGNLGRGSIVKFDPVTGNMTNVYTFMGGQGSYPGHNMVEVCITPAPAGSSSVELCDGATVADLDATGTAIKWYDSASSSTQLSAGTALSSGTYYASQTIQCPSSERLAVNVTIQDPPDVSVSLAGQTLTVNQSGATYQWIRCANNSNIIGATEQSYTATANGEYKVRVTLGPCVATSTCIAIEDVSINELDISAAVIYPNPAQAELTVEFAQRLQSIELLDPTGRLVLSSAVIGSRTMLDLGQLPAGNYLLRLTDMDGRMGHRLIVKE